MSTRFVRRARKALSLARHPLPHESREMYLDLTEKAILHSLYAGSDRGEPPEVIKAQFAKGLADHPEFALTSDHEARNEGRDWPLHAQTMIGARRLRNVRRCVQEVLADGISGDLIEAGCWRGGAAILMRATLKVNGALGRTVFVADSFSGVPAPDPERYPADAGDINHLAPELAVSLDEVRANFERYGLLDEGVRFVEGLFADTLPGLADRDWALIRLDGDLYESTMDGLRNLYPRLSPGGFLIIDDYGFPNCRTAVEDYRKEHGIDEPITEIDWAGAFWRRRG